jgi:lipopolysaccharide export system protein LptA
MIIIHMINKRSTFIVILFLFITVFVILMAQNVKKNKESYTDYLDVEIDDESIFKNMTYYSLDENRKNLNLNADHLKIINEKSFYFENTIGSFFDKENKETKFETSSGRYESEKEVLSFNEGVELVTEDADYSADKLILDQKNKKLNAIGNVKTHIKDLKTDDELEIKSDSMNSDLAREITFFKGSVEGELKRKRRYEGGFTFSSAEMQLNQPESLIKLDKGSKLHRNNYDVEAQKAEIFLENYNKRLKYYVLYDDIKFVEKLELKSGETKTRKAYAEKMEGFIAQAKIILTGAPRVEQDGDLLKGYQITLRENVEFVEVDDSQSSFQLNKRK